MKLENQIENPSQRFADLFGRLEQSEAYLIDALKIELSEQIYGAMKHQGVNKAELARRLGTSRAYITKLLQGSTNLTLESLVKISKALNCQLDIHLSNREVKQQWEQPQKQATGGKLLHWPNRSGYVKSTRPVNNANSEASDARRTIVA
jgi:transcriptional regulator with XRE-family HTH domain